MMKVLYIILSLAFLLVTACDGTEGSGKGSGSSKSAAFKIVKENIEKMGTRPWRKTAYTNIKENQITNLSKETERSAATDLLNRTYADLMIKEAKRILNGNCSGDNPHGHLSELFNELKGFSDTPGYDEVAKMKKIHDEALTFANSGIGYQRVTSYRDSYDENYENSKKQKAQSYLSNSSVKCIHTRNKLERLTTPEAYQGRRRAYCEDIVREYLLCSNPANSERNAAIGRLSTSGYRGSKSTWENKIDNHYQSLQQSK